MAADAVASTSTPTPGTPRDPVPPPDAAPVVANRGRRSRAAIASVLRPGRAVAATAARVGRATRAWSGRPVGRFAIALAALLAALSLAGSAGAYLVPSAMGATARPNPTASAAAAAPALPVPTAGAIPAAPGAGTTAGATAGPVPLPSRPSVSAGPQEVLSSWARKLSGPLGIPVVALQAYGYAELALNAKDPGCHLSWTTLAGIGKIESNHGRANGAILQPDGRALPPIIGPALNGQNGTALVRDTDQGRWDNDRVYDHAVGPMQFLPATWVTYGVDADGDGQADPNDINDAALAAADYLCAGGRDLSTPGGWWAAILSYNELAAYARDVFDAANAYGAQSRDVT